MKALIFVCMVLSVSLGVNVNGVETAETGGYLVVALSTSPVYRKSDGDKVIAEYYVKYSTMHPDKAVVVTRDSDVYYGLKYARESDDGEKLTYYAERAVKRNSRYAAKLYA